jgi:sodium transport system permease protein
MNWSNVLLILQREIRDQLRDRRTLFMIFVLPILLYPFMGIVWIQLLQFTREHPTDVLLIGAEQLPDSPPLLVRDPQAPAGSDVWLFDPGLFAERSWSSGGDMASVDGEPLPEQRLLRVYRQPRPADANSSGAAPSADERLRSQLQPQLEEGTYQAVVVFPADFGARIAAFRQRLEQPGLGDAPSEPLPAPEILYVSSKKKSQIAQARLRYVLANWRDRLARQMLREARMPQHVAEPFLLAERDVAASHFRSAALWSTVFPFMLLIWSLTGAFYPAVDLCAGEKERGTLETLLSGPAERSEIVGGKLLTIMLFSMVTVILNLLSIAATGYLVIVNLGTELPTVAPPPPLALVWLFLAMLPVSALFSALCLALAAFARSTKEGQYYLMPLFLITLPLVILPMDPRFELNLGNSLVPVTGMVLILRTLIEGDYAIALQHLAPVLAVTGACCWVAIRWAVDQFNKESVLFRESERLDLGVWLRHLVRDRDDTPTPAAAFLCGGLILVVITFLQLVIAGKVGDASPLRQLVMVVVVPQLAAILTPALLMSVLFTRSPRKTLLLKVPPRTALLAVAALAVAFHPVAQALADGVHRLYPISPEIQASIESQLRGVLDHFWLGLAVVALLPAVCEELAFRGFILSGLRHLGHPRMAIVFSSIMFGMVHAVIQQQVVATIVGVLIGYLALRTGSIFCCMAFHAIHNALAFSSHRLAQWLPDSPALAWLYRLETQSSGGTTLVGLHWQWPAVLLGGIVSLAVVVLIRRFPYELTEEESLQDAIEHQQPVPVA